LMCRLLTLGAMICNYAFFSRGLIHQITGENLNCMLSTMKCPIDPQPSWLMERKHYLKLTCTMMFELDRVLLW
jgi:hypothetical protein